MSRRIVSRSSLLLVAGLLIATDPLVASAAGHITGADIKNGSVTGADIKNHSLTKDDLRAGTLPSTARVKTASWSLSYAGGQSVPHNYDTPVGSSTGTIPAGTEVTGLNIDVSGDFSGCNDYFLVRVHVSAGPTGHYEFDTSGYVAQYSVNGPSGNNGPAGEVDKSLQVVIPIGASALPLSAVAFCSDNEQLIQVPAFQATVRVAYESLPSGVDRQL